MQRQLYCTISINMDVLDTLRKYKAKWHTHSFNETLQILLKNYEKMDH